MSWEVAIADLFGISTSSPHWLKAFALLFVLYLTVIFPALLFFSYLRRKMGADLQARIGPNQAGPAGSLQPFADVMKLLQKKKATRNVAATSYDRILEVWLVLSLMLLFSTAATVPFGSFVILLDADMSIFIPFFVALVLALGTMFVGFLQGTVSGTLGGVRVIAQCISGFFPAILSLFCAVLHSGGFQWSKIVESQGASPIFWTFVSSPFQFLSLVVFLVSGLVFLNLAPLDAAWSFSDLRGGVVSGLYGARLSVFRLGQIYLLFLWSLIASVLFLGAWNLPNFLNDALVEGGHFWLLFILQVTVLMVKTTFLVMFITWVARVNPRVRTDQLTDLAWKVLGPVSLCALAGEVLWLGGRTLL